MTLNEAKKQMTVEIERKQKLIENGKFESGRDLQPKDIERITKSLTTLRAQITMCDKWIANPPQFVTQLTESEKAFVNAYEISDLQHGQFRYKPV